MKKKYFYIVILFAIFLVPSLYAANIYVDKTLSGNITNGSYSTANRNSSGSDGNAYTTVQAAINAMSSGDHILLRGGTYQEGAIIIPILKNGTSWNEGQYNKLASFPGEWAILDGQSNCEVTGASVIGYFAPSHSESSDLKYWWFERLEIMGGGRANRQDAGGFGGNGGPFKFRFIYFHDNHADTGANNPGGLKVYHMHDSVVEFCYFENNGCSGTDTNCAHILIFSDYNWRDTAENGYDPDDPYARPGARNIYRYNYMTDSVVGFKYKGTQLFTGKNPNGGHGFDDTYKDYGDHFHHNYISDARRYGVGAHQDFFQAYNNIFDNSYSGIKVHYQPSAPLYKVVNYNNTIVDSTTAAIMRYADNYYAFETYQYFGYDYNNLVDNCQEVADAWSSASFDVAAHSTANPDWDLTGYIGSNNYVYRPVDTSNYQLNRVSYTQSGYESQTYTSPVLYRNVYDGGNPLFQGTSGSDKYITIGTHTIEAGATAADGGTGEPHPYLNGVTLPDYVGATNPDDHAWVAGVLSLSNVATLMNGGSGDPEWVEGGGGVAPPPSIQAPADFKHISE